MATTNIFDLHSLTRQQRVVLQYTDKNDVTTEILKLDASVYEEPVLESQATVHPLLDGSEISDHVIKKPTVLTLKGVISDHPINVGEAIIGGIGGIMGNMFNPITGAMVGLAAGQAFKIGNKLLTQKRVDTETGEITYPSRSKTAYQALYGIYNDKRPCDIITGLTTFKNMIMERLSIPRDAKTANSLTFTARFKEVIFVSPATAQIPAAAINAEQKATDKTNLGQQGTSSPTSGVKERAETWGYATVIR